MSAIDREAIRPAFEANPRYRLAEFDRAVEGDRSRMPVGEYRDPSLANEFAGFCAAMESLLTDAAIERSARALCDYYDTIPERATYLQRKSCTLEWCDREEVRTSARDTILAAITGKAE